MGSEFVFEFKFIFQFIRQVEATTVQIRSNNIHSEIPCFRRL